MTTGDKMPARYKRKTDDEINELAKRVYRNEVFVSWMMARPEDLPMVFMILNFIEPATAQQWVKDEIHFFYEDYDRARGGSVNGYPIFFSAHCLNKEDGHRLHAKVKEIAALVG